MRGVGVRKKERQDVIRLGQNEKSVIAEQIHDKVTSHKINSASLEVKDRVRKTKKRIIREAFSHLTKTPKINRDERLERSVTWNAIL